MIKLKIAQNSIKISQDELEFISDLCFIINQILPPENDKYEMAENLQTKIDQFLQGSTK